MANSNIPLIHKDIRQAHTLPGMFYRDPSVYTLMKQELFNKTWNYIGHTALLPEDGYCHPFTLLEDCLDEPLILSRDHDGSIRCLSNVCTHRGTVLLKESGKKRMISCSYHGRCFRLDGRFKSMPGFEDVADFPSESDHLKSLPLERIGPLLFTSVDARFSFREIFGAMMDRLSWLPLDTLEYDPTTSRDYELDANWALYCDNYLEGFHIPFVHPALNDALTDDYSYELFPFCNLQLGIAKDDEPHFDVPEGTEDYGKNVYAYYYWVFPNLMFNWYPWGLSLNVVEPRGIDKTRIRFLSFKYRDTPFHILDNRLHETEMEDEAVVRDVQAGIQSQIYDRGRYSPSMEQGVHHFHGLLTGWLRGNDE